MPDPGTAVRGGDRFETDWAGSSARRSEPLPDHEEAHRRAEEDRRQRIGVRGDPTAWAAAVLAVVDADQPPLRAFLGSAPLGIARADYESRLAEWEAWQDNAVRAQGGA